MNNIFKKYNLIFFTRICNDSNGFLPKRRGNPLVLKAHQVLKIQMQLLKVGQKVVQMIILVQVKDDIGTVGGGGDNEEDDGKGNGGSVKSSGGNSSGETIGSGLGDVFGSGDGSKEGSSSESFND